jgi:hypothetical protein
MFPGSKAGAPSTPSRYVRRYEAPRGRDDHAMVKRKALPWAPTAFEGLLRGGEADEQQYDVGDYVLTGCWNMAIHVWRYVGRR